MGPAKVALKPLVFLDVDGVLNSARNYAEYSRVSKQDPPPKWDETRHELLLLDARCIGVLNDITRATDAEIVISSSWRIWYQLEELAGTLYRAGVEARVIGKTPHLMPPKLSMPAVERGWEIHAWLKKHRPQGTKMLVLDDCDDMDRVWPWFHQTGLGALQSADVDPAVRILHRRPWTPHSRGRRNYGQLT